ncbi:MAG TPA: methionine--tRNA ligase [Polyangia bacterium]|jgi:methionyl-tRNA synthetase|nr:methionine--tRNA ligase [Polyangia bacterium]
MMSRFYITTPIYYVNALPHLGTFYSTVVADALARYHRARDGKDSTFFLTGLDEHGQKIERMAREKGLDPKTYCDQIAGGFRAVWQRAGISYDRFIRTTDGDHRLAVEEMWRRLVARGDIYAADYDGLYCVGCEEWKSEDDVIVEAGEKICPIHRKPVERVKEKNYFFRLSAYADRLLDWYNQTPSPVQPESRRNEVAEFVRRGLRDISVSRMSVKWGIPVPGDPEHVVYVWIDALTNYVTALGGPAEVEAGRGLGAFWPAVHHLIAKDILRFHAVYWPAMLWSAGLPAPKEVFCHGYLTVKGQKISKSIPATRVDPNAIADELGIDPLRYFVLREYTLGGDGDFTYEALFQRYESDLGNDLGNLLNRTVSMAHRYVGGNVAAAAGAAELAAAARANKSKAEQAWADFSPSRALEATWQIVRDFNGYIEATKPWALAKDPARSAELETMLSNCCEALRWAALMVGPAMPHAAQEILRQLGRSADAGSWPDGWAWPGGHLEQPTPVFPRIDPDKQAALIARWMPAEASAAPTATTTPAEIAIDDFAKFDLRAAKVIACERVKKADKLLMLTLDVGTEQRTVVSGIAAAYEPEQLVGKTVIYLANLKPAKIRGVVSQGMILAAGDAEVLGLSTLDRDVAPGTKIR